MATGKKSLTYREAVEAIYRYWMGETVHCITSDYGVNPYRFYGALHGTEHIGAQEEAMALLESNHPLWAKTVRSCPDFPRRPKSGTPDLFAAE